MDSSSFDFIQLLKLVSERRSLKQMYRFWLTREQMEDGDNMLAIHYMDALKKPEKRKAVFEKLSCGAKALLAVLVNKTGPYYEASREEPNSPLKMRRIDPGEFRVMHCLDMGALTEGYLKSNTMASLSELHYYGVAYYTDPDLWPPSDLTQKHADGCIIAAPGFAEDKIPLPKIGEQLLAWEDGSKIEASSLNTDFCQWLNNFMALVEKGVLRFNLQGRFYASSQECINACFPPSCTQLFLEYLMRFGLDNFIISMDSGGTLACGPEMQEFRLMNPMLQVQKYIRWRATCPTLFSKGEYDPVYNFLEKHLLRRVFAIMVQNAGHWTSQDAIARHVDETIRQTCSEGKPKKGWEYRQAKDCPFDPEKTASILNYEILRRGIITGLLQEGRDVAGKKYLKLSPLGENFTGLAPLPVFDTSKSKLIVKSDFEIVLVNSGVFDETDHFLRLFCEKDKTSTYDTAIYHLKQKGIQEANSHGRPVSMLLDFLEKRSGAPLPENVVTTLGDWITNEVTLHKDACCFTFSKEEEAQKLFNKLPGKFTKIGKKMLLCHMGEEAILKLTTQSNIKAMDYSLPPSEFITVTTDGEVLDNGTSDIRLLALCRDISEEKADGLGRLRRELSIEKIASLPSPKAFYQKLNRVLSTDTALLTKLRILRYLGLIPDRGPITVLNNCSASTRQQLQQHISWCRCIGVQIALLQYAVRDGFENELGAAMEKLAEKRCNLLHFPLL